MKEQERNLDKARDKKKNGSPEETLKYGKASQSPMMENVDNVNVQKSPGDDTEQIGSKDEPVTPRSRQAADINGVDWPADQENL